MPEWRRYSKTMADAHYFSVWVTSGTQNPPLGILPVGASVYDVDIDVQQAFNSGGSDEIQVGHDSDNDAYATLTDVSTTGVKSVTLGAGIGYLSVARQIEAYYVNGGGEPTTGKALVTLFYTLNPRQP